MANKSKATNSYSNLMNQIGALTKQAEAVRKQESSSVLNKIRQTMKEFGITPNDLVGSGASAKKQSTKLATRSSSPSKTKNVVAKRSKLAKAPEQPAVTKTVAKKNSTTKLNAEENVRKNKFSTRRKPEPKYMNPETGQTWSGRGKTPTWLQGRRKSRFAITNATAVSA